MAKQNEIVEDIPKLLEILEVVQPVNLVDRKYKGEIMLYFCQFWHSTEIFLSKPGCIVFFVKKVTYVI